MPGEDEQAGAWHTGGANSSWARLFVVRREGEGDRSEDRTDRGEEPEPAGHGQSLNSRASWALSHRKVAWEGVSTLSNAEVQAFPLDPCQRGTPPPLHLPLLGGLESAAGRGLGFQAGNPTLTTSTCMQRVGS